MLTFDTRPLDRLIPYVRNARTHSAGPSSERRISTVFISQAVLLLPTQLRPLRSTSRKVRIGG